MTEFEKDLNDMYAKVFKDEIAAFKKSYEMEDDINTIKAYLNEPINYNKIESKSNSYDYPISYFCLEIEDGDDDISNRRKIVGNGNFNVKKDGNDKYYLINNYYGNKSIKKDIINKPYIVERKGHKTTVEMYTDKYFAELSKIGLLFDDFIKNS